jgi:SAM-dependent methyltransferase
VTPWDAGGVPLKLGRWLEKKLPVRVLVPGCGSGYEVRFFAEHGHDVLGIDFSDAAIEAAQQELGSLASRVRKADFFALGGEFDLVYERAFLCALPRARWPDWARSMAGLVRPGGELAGFFYLDDNQRGPPFGISRPRLHELLDERFDLTADEPVPPEESIAVFQGREIWQVWKRRL